MVTTFKIRNPGWWGADIESAWNRVKDAVKREWTQYDLGPFGKADLNQPIGGAVRQAQSWEDIPPHGKPKYDEIELAFRFGYGAHVQFGGNHASWDKDLVEFLREEWEKLPANQRRSWMEDRTTIRYGWEFEP